MVLLLDLMNLCLNVGLRNIDKTNCESQPDKSKTGKAVNAIFILILLNYFLSSQEFERGVKLVHLL